MLIKKLVLLLWIIIQEAIKMADLGEYAEEEVYRLTATKKERIVHNTITTLVYGAVAATFLSIPFIFSDSNKSRQQMQQNAQNKSYLVEKLADVNRDGVTSAGEWGKVYEELGIRFDHRNPISLNENDFDRYLAAHRRTPR